VLPAGHSGSAACAKHGRRCSIARRIIGLVGTRDVGPDEQLFEQLLGRTQAGVLDVDVAFGVCSGIPDSQTIRFTMRRARSSIRNRPAHIQPKTSPPLAWTGLDDHCAASGMVMK